MIFSAVKKERGRPIRTLEEVVKQNLVVNNIFKNKVKY